MSGLLGSQSACKLVFIFIPIYVGCITYVSGYDLERVNLWSCMYYPSNQDPSCLITILMKEKLEMFKNQKYWLMLGLSVHIYTCQILANLIYGWSSPCVFLPQRAALLILLQWFFCLHELNTHPDYALQTEMGFFPVGNKKFWICLEWQKYHPIGHNVSFEKYYP